MIPTKVRSHLVQNEDLIFEQSSPGKTGYQLPPLDVPEVDPAAALGARNVRAEIEDFPEVSEVEVIRHFTRLSTWNYAIDLGMYPLGSCTMKYNPRINEAVRRASRGLPGRIRIQPESLSQGVMEGHGAPRKRRLLEITGLDAITLQPAYGGALYGGTDWHPSCLFARFPLKHRVAHANAFSRPISAHGTNPATAGIAKATKCKIFVPTIRA